MGNNQNNIISNGEVELAQPIKQIAINVSLKDWNKIKDRIKKISCKSSKFSTASSVMWGIAGSSFIAIFPFIFPLNAILLIITIMILITSCSIGIILTITAKHENTIQETTKENVLEFMNDIEEHFDLSKINKI